MSYNKNPFEVYDQLLAEGKISVEKYSYLVNLRTSAETRINGSKFQDVYEDSQGPLQRPTFE